MGLSHQRAYLLTANNGQKRERGESKFAVHDGPDDLIVIIK